AMLVLAPARDAAAQTDPRATEARELFTRGVALVRDQRWSEALALFERSLALVDRPNTRFNVATCLLRTGRAADAARTFDAFLALPTQAVEPALRAEAMRLRGEALRAIGTVVLHASPPDAQVDVDGTPVRGEGPERTLRVDPGRRLV